MNTILLIRLGAIGDVVFTSPFVQALRMAYPDARIVWLCEPPIKPLLEAEGVIDKVLVWPKQEWLALLKKGKLIKLFAAWKRLRDDLRAMNIDLAVDLQGLLKSGVWAWFSGAKERIGLGSKEGSQYLMTKVVSKGGNGALISSEYRYLAEQMKLPLTDRVLSLSIDDSSHQQARDILASRVVNSKFAVLLPFTTRPQKHWFDESWRQLIGELQQQGFGVVLLGGPADKSASDTITRNLDGVVNLVGETSLLTAAAITSRAAIVIGVDTGLTHMGHALQRPTISLFGSTCPYLDPANPYGIVIYHKLWCSPCRRHPICNNEYSCMGLITVDEIMSLVDRLALES